MSLSFEKDGTRFLQITFVGLLVICVAQVAWWYLDQVRFTAQTQDRMLTTYQTEVAFAQRLKQEGVSDDAVMAIFGNLERQANGDIIVAPNLVEALVEARARRLNRYKWEAGFFLLVLFLGIGVLWRSLRAYDELRRRQQNLLAAVSHEFKTPLASLRLSTGSLARRTPTPERLKRLTARMVGDLDRLESMVENLLNTTRLEDGQFQLNAKPLILKEAIMSVVEDSLPRAVAKGILIDMEAPNDLSIHVDLLAFRTVLQNLVDNAIKATAATQGGSISIKGQRQGNMAVVVVEDTGIGFNVSETNKLFDKFYRPGDELRRQGGGSGLGLYLVKGLVKRSGGWVKATSPGPNKGAIFQVAFPIHK